MMREEKDDYIPLQLCCFVLILREERGRALMQLEWIILLPWSSLEECVTYEVMRKKELMKNVINSVWKKEKDDAL